MRQPVVRIMPGCMNEISAGRTTAVHLAPLSDWTDLGGNILVNNDPFKGVENRNGEIILSGLPGSGVVPTP